MIQKNLKSIYQKIMQKIIIFDYIVEEKKLIKFILEDEKQDLYNEIVLDVLEQINNEISASKENFEKIFDLLGNKDDIFQNTKKLYKSDIIF